MPSPSTLEELLDRWNRGQFAETQAITHILLLLREQAQRLETLERQKDEEHKM